MTQIDPRVIDAANTEADRMIGEAFAKMEQAHEMPPLQQTRLGLPMSRKDSDHAPANENIATAATAHDVLPQIVSVTDEARAVESEIAPGILVRFADDTGLSLVGPDAIAISQLLHMHSLRSRTPEDEKPKIVAPAAGKIVQG